MPVLNAPTEVTPSPNARRWAGFLQTVLKYQRDKVVLAVAARNTIGVALPLIVSASFDQMAVGLALCAGSLNVCWADSHDAYRLRARKMLAASFLVGLTVFLGIRFGHIIPLSIALTGLWAFAAGMAVALGTTTADLGVISLVTLVVAAGSVQPPDRALNAGLLALSGALFQTALSLLSWPFQAYRPERRAIGELFLAISRAAADPPQAIQSPPATAQSTAAQSMLSALQGDHSLTAQRYLLLLAQAERIRLAILLFSRFLVRLQRESPDSVEAICSAGFLPVCSRILLGLGTSLAAGEPPKIPQEAWDELNQLTDRMSGYAGAASPQLRGLLAELSRQMDALAGQLRSASELAFSSTPDGLELFAKRESAKRWRLQFAGPLATLRANLCLDSAVFRHAVRLSVCAAAGSGIGDALAQQFGFPRGYWVPMTVAIVLKPDFTATFSRGVLRLLGTFAGLVASTLAFWIMPASPVTDIAIVTLTMFITRGYGPANYGILTAAVTALVVALIAITGVQPAAVMPVRALATVIGGIISLLAYLAWPTWERRLLPATLANVLDAYRNYFRVLRESYESPDHPVAHRLDATRQAGRLARSNLEASLDRVAAEPGTSPETLALLNAIIATSNRLAYALMALEAGLSASSPVPPRKAFAPFANHVEMTLYLLAAVLRGSRVLPEDFPNLRLYHRALTHSGEAMTDRYALVNIETDRITNSLNTLREQVAKWLGREEELNPNVASLTRA